MIVEHPRLIQFFTDEEEKQQFKLACRLNDTTMSQALRRFIREYIREYPCQGVGAARSAPVRRGHEDTAP